MDRKLNVSEMFGLIDQITKDIPKVQQLPGTRCRGSVQDRDDGRYVEGICMSEHTTLTIRKTPREENLTFQFIK
jgi:hypothetical protein